MIEVKKDPFVLGFAAIIALIGAGLAYEHVVQGTEYLAFMSGLILPSIFGRTQDSAKQNPPTLPIVFVVLFLSSVFGGATLAACFRPTAEQVNATGDAVCTLVDAYAGTPEARTICATAQELADLALLAQFATHDGGKVGVSQCRIVPKTTVCADESSIAIAIDATLAKRRK